MPTYDYECATCEKVFEIFQQMSDEPIKKCPDCDNLIKRLVSGGLGVIFKGSGFYVNDSKKSSNSSSSKDGKRSNSSNGSNSVASPSSSNESSSGGSSTSSDKSSTQAKKTDTKSA